MRYPGRRVSGRFAVGSRHPRCPESRVRTSVHFRVGYLSNRGLDTSDVRVRVTKSGVPIVNSDRSQPVLEGDVPCRQDGGKAYKG